MKNRSHRPSHGPKYIKYLMCLSVMTVICTKQYLSNIWNSIHEKVKQHWGWAGKKAFLRPSQVNFLVRVRQEKRKKEKSGR